VGLGFPNAIPACMDSISIFFLAHLTLLLPLAHSLLKFEFCQRLLLTFAALA